MKLTIIQTGDVPEALVDRHGPYHSMFQRMFDSVSSDMSYEVVVANANSPLPNSSLLEGIVITGSPAGVYDDLPWIDPLRSFIRTAYAARVPMLGICFGHQIMADALGGDVRKSEKGWGLGRHCYSVVERPDFMADAPDTLSIACSHQDQVISPPSSARVILSTPFTPNAGLYYETGKALSFQPHPEFEDEYAIALAEMRRERIGTDMTNAAVSTFASESDSRRLAEYIVRFFKNTGAPAV